MSKTTRKVLIDTLLGLVVAAAVSIPGGLFQAQNLGEICRILSDGFFVAAVILLGCGGLVWTYNGGVMDGLTFSVKTFVARIRKDYDQTRETFMEYREKREAKNSSPKYLLLSGLIHLVIALAVFAVYLIAV